MAAARVWAVGAQVTQRLSRAELAVVTSSGGPGRLVPTAYIIEAGLDRAGCCAASAGELQRESLGDPIYPSGLELWVRDGMASR